MRKLMFLIVMIPLVITAKSPGKITLKTERGIFIAGEEMQFLATLSTDSKVLYAEILTADGKTITKDKFLINGDTSSGCLIIPKNTITGVYFLRTYTREMRNDGPESYTYLAIRIVNPLSGEVLAGTEEVRWDGPVKPHIIVLNRDSADYCPELVGVAISGLVKSSKTGKPIIGKLVNLSILDGENEFMSVKTDSNGRFHFIMPVLYGWREIYLGLSADQGSDQAISVKDDEVSILADNDFCSVPVKMPAYIFTLTSDERLTAYKLAVNAKKRLYADTIADSIKRPFYGTPHQVLSLAEYVQLPTLEEYFNELPGIVKVRRINGKKQFRVLGSRAEMPDAPPLVLIDNVPVDDAGKILAVPPIAIDRIEMINEPYLKGGTLYGGIISIFSKKGDYAGVELPASGIFIKYRFLNTNCL